MKRRIFICGFLNFPRGSASSNYVQYMAITLADAGYDVHLVTDVNHTEEAYLAKLQERVPGGINIHPFKRQTKKPMRYLQHHYLLGRDITAQLKKQKIGGEDIVITYTSSTLVHKAVYKFARRRGAKVGATIVEWYAREDMSSDKAYRRYSDYFENQLPKFDFLIPISTYIRDQFEGKGVKSFVLPVIEDPHEYERYSKDCSGKMEIIYPANGMMKDAITHMLSAIVKLTEAERARLELHLCGIKRTAVTEIIGEEAFAACEDCIHLHGWMTYDELIELYRSCHFLLLARKTRQLTMANFPGKVPETMMHGVVPIVSVVGDYTKYYLRDGENALLMEGYTSKEIHEALRRALAMHEEEYQRLSDAAYATVCNELSYETWSGRLREFLEKV